MSGPPYPRPGGHSSAIGEFVIGLSPIGVTNPFDFWKTVISQYANSPILTTLLDNFSQYLDQNANLDAFFNLIWNVLTAEGYGLDVWGRIVGVHRTFQSLNTTRNLGFDEATILNADPWNQSPFFSGPNLTDTFSIDDTTFRRLILSKAMANISDGSIPSINKILLNLFPGRGNCYVRDAGNMTMTYTFTFPLSDEEYAMLTQSNVLPKPSGVMATIQQL